MTPARTVGPYRIVRPLGRGGMGRVLEGIGPDGHVVAIKTVAVRDPAQRDAIEREIHALARLSHPGIVRIVASGTEDGSPWYAMELIEGTTLRAVMEHGWQRDEAARGTEPLASRSTEPTELLRRSAGVTELARGASSHEGGTPLSEGLEIVRRICAALACLHGEGLVHRDLKPENVVMRADGSPVLVDFGLAVPASDREALASAAEPAGTTSYVSPEQAAGELVDARADLYALGCMLFELLTGRVPYVGADPASVIWQHRNAPVPRLSDVATAASPELDALLSRLLSKEPAERIGYAADVDDALAALGVPAPEQDVPARPYLYRPALVGREPILETVAGRIQRIEHGEAGGIVFLSGETGSGKTRLLIEAARMAMDRGLTVLRGGSAASAPLSLLADAIRRALEIARASGDAPSPADPVVAALAAYLPSLDGVKRAPELPEEGARLRLFAAISRSLEAAARRKPVVLLLDGLDQADELTLGWLSQEARTGPRERLLVAGTLCTTTSAPAELTALARSTHVTVLPLGPYDATEVERLIGSMLACREVPEGLAGLLAERSGGNPFFVAEYLRLAVAQGVLTRDAGTWVVAPSASARRTLSAYGALPAPRSLHDLSVERVRALQPAAAEILGVVAILGPDANREILAAVGCDPSVVQAAVHELVSRDVAIESAGTLRAAHPAMGDAAASLLPADLRRGVHQRAALALGTPEDPAKLGRVARHWAEAGEAARARACYRSAATGEIERLALAEGVELLRRFLELSPGPCLEDLDARDELGRTLRHSGRSAEAVDVLRVALDDARRIGVPARESHTSRGLANALRQLGKVEEALALCRSALALARQAGALTEEAAALATLGTVLSDLGRNVEARELLREALARHRASGDPRTIANSARTLGTIAFESGLTDEAEALFTEAYEIAKAHRYGWAEVHDLTNIAAAAATRGHTARARALCEEAMARARVIGDLQTEATLILNIGVLDERRGAADAVLVSARRAAALFREIGDLRMAAAALRLVASSQRWCGDGAGSLATIQESLRLHRDVGDLRGEGLTLRQLAESLWISGRIEEAREAADTALARARQVQDTRSEANALSYVAAYAADLREATRTIAQAVRIMEAANDVHGLSFILLVGAGCHRRAGDLDQAEAMLDRASRILSSPEERFLGFHVTCERGLLAAARGEDPRPFLSRAEAEASAMGMAEATLPEVLIELRAAAAAAP